MSDAAYRLITAGPSPYGRKVEVALIEKGLEYEVIYDLPWAEAVETRKHSPLEQLPILLPADGEPVFDSAMILDWLELVHPEPALVPTDCAARINCLYRRTLGERLMEIAQALVFELHRDGPAQASVERLTRKVTGGLNALDRMLGAPDARTLDCDQGDIAVATTLLCWEFIVEEGMIPPVEVLQWRARHERIAQHVERIKRRSSFARTHPSAMQVEIGREVSARPAN